MSDQPTSDCACMNFGHLKGRLDELTRERDEEQRELGEVVTFLVFLATPGQARTLAAALLAAARKTEKRKARR